jgi:hypothetical protein
MEALLTKSIRSNFFLKMHKQKIVFVNHAPQTNKKLCMLSSILDCGISVGKVTIQKILTPEI